LWVVGEQESPLAGGAHENARVRWPGTDVGRMPGFYLTSVTLARNIV